MEFLRFIFSSFWVWLGFVVLVAAAVEPLRRSSRPFARPGRLQYIERATLCAWRLRAQAAGIFRRRLKPQRSGTRRTRNERGVIEQ